MPESFENFQGDGGWSIYQRRQLENRLADLRVQRLKVEQELAKLNTGELSEQPPAIAALTLKQFLTRDAEEMRRAVIREGINILQLKLELGNDEFSEYRAVIETDEGIGIYTINNLKAQSASGGKVLFLNLPSRLLPTGSYQVHLSGITAQKELADIGIYSFQVILK